MGWVLWDPDVLDEKKLKRITEVFQTLRSETTKNRVLKILKYLDEQDGWVRDKDLKKFVFGEEPTHEQQFYRTINLLLKNDLIIRKEILNARTPGSKPVYYRTHGSNLSIYYGTREELIKGIFQLDQNLQSVNWHYFIACSLLNEHVDKKTNWEETIAEIERKVDEYRTNLIKGNKMTFTEMQNSWSFLDRLIQNPPKVEKETDKKERTFL